MQRKRWISFVCFFLGVSALAFEWNLPGRAWTAIDPPAVWSFYAAPRKGSPGEWKVLAQKDMNYHENRLMFSEENGDPWSVPAIRVQNFQNPGEQLLEFLTAAASDPVAVYRCTVAGTLAFEAVVTDPVPADGPGTDGNARFRISRIGADHTEQVLDEFSFRGKKAETRTGRIAVSPGDLICFRKTASLVDDYGRRSCRVSLKVNLEPAGTASGLWAAAVPAGRNLLAEHIFLQGRSEDGETDRFDLARISGRGVPFATVRKVEDGSFEISARAEKNEGAAFGAGDLVLYRKIELSGNYRVRIEASNPGLDVKGGDGGSLTLSVLPPDSIADCAAVFRLGIPASRAAETPVVSDERILKLNAGDLLSLRLNAGIDGYADRFQIRFQCEPTAEDGIAIPPPAPDSVLPFVGEKRNEPVVSMRNGLFWLGASGAWVSGPDTAESIQLISKFVPDLAVIGVNSRPDLLPAPAFLRERNIPVLTQNFGTGYESYWRYMGAFEWDSNRRAHAEKSFIALSGMAHAAAMPHPAVREAFDRLMRSSVRHGYAGYGFNDMVWHWGPGRGASGYNPETIQAFRQSLKGEDEGFLFGWRNVTPRRWYFRDYVNYYLGCELHPEAFGFKSWDDYRPLLAPEYEAKRKAGKDVTADGMLLDLLVHYEWLKAADRIGRAAKEEGGFFQVLPNPEDLANGNDFLFLAGLTNVDGRTEEYFSSPLFMSGAYCRFPYFRDRTAAGTQTGIVLEAGAGGNSKPYYTAKTSLKTAYEITLATRADHLEGDFWWGFSRPLAELAKEVLHRDRYGAILAYGLGFRYGREDMSAFTRLEPDFLSITSRRLFRPWGTVYRPWNWWLDTQFSPDQELVRLGYIPAGQGEESLREPDFRSEILFYSASPVTAWGWKRFQELLKSGEVKHGIVMAGALREQIGSDLHPAPFLKLAQPQNVSGKLADASGKILSGNLEVKALYPAPEGFETEFTIGGRPAVVSRKTGKGKLWMLLVTPVPETPGGVSPDAETGRAVYRALLDKLGRQPHWRSGDPIEARLYRNKEGVRLVSAMRYDCLAKEIEGVYPATAPGDASLEVKLNPGHYVAVTFPELRRFDVTTGGDGWGKLDCGRSAYELFFLIPADRAETFVEKLTARAAEFRRAMTLDGISSVPAR
ncbi:hypothetical protein [uncultured Victivallis sp.]|uniref:hypothetical protein n=1 Tax=uncultured Victivallis sp. TaxID=354118 RepID=UPI0025E2B506|nr:hypothetical protein [uncultured Victivallis sp.]